VSLWPLLAQSGHDRYAAILPEFDGDKHVADDLLILPISKNPSAHLFSASALQHGRRNSVCAARALKKLHNRGRQLHLLQFHQSSYGWRADTMEFVVSAPIFISYSSKDQKIAGTIAQALEARGQCCWIASRDVRAGDNFQEAIVRALREAKVMLLVFSANANNSDEIKKELVLAGRHRVIVVPVRVENVVPSDAFSYELATRQWVDLFQDWESQIEQLVAQVEIILAAPGEAPRPMPVMQEQKKSSNAALVVGLAILAVLIAGTLGWLRPWETKTAPSSQGESQRVAAEAPSASAAAQNAVGAAHTATQDSERAAAATPPATAPAPRTAVTANPARPMKATSKPLAGPSEKVALAAAPAPSPAVTSTYQAASIVGVWQGWYHLDSDAPGLRTPLTGTFKADGNMIGQSAGRTTYWQWQQSGSDVRWTNGGTTYNASLTGNHISGTISYAGGSGTFEVNR
jgi:hypothetical protein